MNALSTTVTGLSMPADANEPSPTASSAIRARVTGVGLWAPNCASVEAWQSRRLEEVSGPVKVKILDRACARRASPFAKAMALAFEQAVRQAEVDVASVATVFGSAMGEAQVMLRLLDQMRTQSDEFSPMLFAVSVHNAASGLVSISTKNRAFATSVAADYDTPAMAVLEAVGASADFNVPAVVVCGDEASPDGLVPDDETFQTVTAAVVLDATQTHDGSARGPALAELSDLAIAPADTAGAEAPTRMIRNPQAGLLDLVDAVIRRRYGRVALDRGEGSGWSIKVTEAL